MCAKEVALSAINTHLDTECGSSQTVGNHSNVVNAGHSGDNVSAALDIAPPPVSSSATTATYNTGISGTKSNLLQLDRNLVILYLKSNE